MSESSELESSWLYFVPSLVGGVKAGLWCSSSILTSTLASLSLGGDMALAGTWVVAMKTKLCQTTGLEALATALMVRHRCAVGGSSREEVSEAFGGKT